MANYVASARSNYFRVKDQEAFKKALPGGVGMWTHSTQPEFVAIYVDDGDGGGWPSYDYTAELDENGEMPEVDIGALVSEHLADGQVAVLMEVGAEKLRYLVGQAIVVRAGFAPIYLSLEDLARQKAQEMWGITPTEVAY